jgi:hypothetical protein
MDTTFNIHSVFGHLVVAAINGKEILCLLTKDIVEGSTVTFSSLDRTYAAVTLTWNEVAATVIVKESSDTTNPPVLADKKTAWTALLMLVKQMEATCRHSTVIIGFLASELFLTRQKPIASNVIQPLTCSMIDGKLCLTDGATRAELHSKDISRIRKAIQGKRTINVNGTELKELQYMTEINKVCFWYLNQTVSVSNYAFLKMTAPAPLKVETTGISHNSLTFKSIVVI